MCIKLLQGKFSAIFHKLLQNSKADTYKPTYEPAYFNMKHCWKAGVAKSLLAAKLRHSYSHVSQYSYMNVHVLVYPLIWSGQKSTCQASLYIPALYVVSHCRHFIFRLQRVIFMNVAHIQQPTTVWTPSNMLQ